MTTEPESPMSQGTAAPEVTPEVTPQAPDISTLRVRVGEGPDAEMSVADLQKSYEESRKAMSKAMQEKVELTKRYEWADTFAKDLQVNPGLRQHLESFYAGQTEDSGYRPTQMQGPTRDSIKMAELETKLASFTLNNSLDELGRELKDEFGLELKPEQKAQLWEDVARTNSDDVKGLYWARFGKEVVKAATKQNTKAVANKIAENSGSYANPSPVTPGSMPTETPPMFSAEWNKAVEQEFIRRASK